MRQVLLTIVLVWGVVASTVVAQTAGQRPDRKPVRPGPPPVRVRPPTASPPAKVRPRVPTVPVKQFDRRPEMVTVQALIVTLAFGEGKRGEGAQSAAAAETGSVADVLAKKINAESGTEKTPMSALTKALDGVLKEKAKTASIESLTGMELTTVAGQTAYVQLGHRKPRITGATSSQYGHTNSVTMENVGSIVKITPQVVPDGSLVVTVDIEKSDLGPEAEGMVIATAKDGTEIRSPQIDILCAKTTVTAASGKAVVLGNLICNRESLRKETFVLLRPLLVGATDAR